MYVCIDDDDDDDTIMNGLHVSLLRYVLCSSIEQSQCSYLFNGDDDDDD
jgi:hypothetical protein